LNKINSKIINLISCNLLHGRTSNVVHNTGVVFFMINITKSDENHNKRLVLLKKEKEKEKEKDYVLRETDECRNTLK